MKRKLQDNLDNTMSKVVKTSHPSDVSSTVVKEVFADPTYDFTFKMLFGNEENKDILISALNSLLNFEGDRQIEEVTIISNELLTEGVGDIKSSVDILCTTQNNKKIAVEMQRQYKSYFLPRSQEYMSKLIIGQVKDGQGGKYDEVLMETYVLCIGKQNIFRGTYQVAKEHDTYEKTVVPMIQEHGVEVPGNRMYWKFYELLKFTKEFKSKAIGSSDPIKHQWLDFLVKCGTQSEIPEDIDEIIKRGYKIMEVAKWTEDQRALYWKQKSNEENDLWESNREKEEIAQKSKEEGKIEGEKIGQLKGEIDKILTLLKLNISHDNIKAHTSLSADILSKLIEYIQDGHQNDDPADIGAHLGLFSTDDEVSTELQGDLQMSDDV